MLPSPTSLLIAHRSITKVRPQLDLEAGGIITYKVKSSSKEFQRSRLRDGDAHADSLLGSALGTMPVE